MLFSTRRIQNFQSAPHPDEMVVNSEGLYMLRMCELAILTTRDSNLDRSYRLQLMSSSLKRKSLDNDANHAATKRSNTGNNIGVKFKPSTFTAQSSIAPIASSHWNVQWCADHTDLLHVSFYFG